MNLIKIAQKTLQIEANALHKASQRLDQNFLDAITLIMQTKGKLIITGVGKSGLVGAKIAATFASTGTSSFFLHPTEALHGDLGMIGKEDTLLAISSSGESEELTKILPHIKRFNIPLIGLTSDEHSSLGIYADVVLDISVEKEACPLGIAPTTSTTLTMALGDALAVALMEKRGFKKEDFASFHPGGTLGKKLFIRIKDLMRTNDLPIIEEDTTLKDAMILNKSISSSGAVILNFLTSSRPSLRFVASISSYFTKGISIFSDTPCLAFSTDSFFIFSIFCLYLTSFGSFFEDFVILCLFI